MEGLHGAQFLNMQQVRVYDRQHREWYLQSTTFVGGSPPPSRQFFCSLILSAPDNSSHSIFIYGGRNAGATQELLGDIWVLTIPSFQWVKLADEVPRGEHTCALLQDRYMLVYGGRILNESACDDENHGIGLYDLQTLIWTTKYEFNTSRTTPSGTGPVPKAVYDVIGGSASGGATVTAPEGGFDGPALTALFALNLSSPTSTSVPPPSNSTVTGAVQRQSTKAGPIAGGIVGGVAFAALVGVLIYLGRRRRNRSQTKRADGVSPPESDLQAVDSADKDVREQNELKGKAKFELNGLEQHELMTKNNVHEAANGEICNPGVHELDGDQLPRFKNHADV
jgi:hypothetical protein